MSAQKSITHEEFAREYKAGNILVYVDPIKAGDFVLSDFAKPENKPAHLFWTWAGIILIVPLPIVLLFIKWPLAPLSFILGIVVHQAARKSAGQFVIQNMVENEDFWDYILMHKGAEMKDPQGNQIRSAFQDRMR